jgi:hypothetical protein
MKIQLTKELALKTRCYYWEAERSVHVLLDPRSLWADFLVYFDKKKMDELRQIRLQLQKHLSPSLVMAKISRANLAKQWQAPGFFRVVFGGWLARFQLRFGFRPLDVNYLLQGLDSFLDFFDHQSKPDNDSLIQLRMMLTDCGTIIDQRCYGWEEMKHVKRISYFGCATWFPTVSLSQFLAKAA